jgi:phage host-nuclease inhibitor protein Gam
MDNRTDLEKFLDSKYELPDNAERFTIDTDSNANWAIRKALRYQKNIDDAKALAEEQIRDINNWLEHEIGPNQYQVDFFLGLLRPYAEAKIEGAKSKTVKLPSGNISFRTQNPQFYIGVDKVDGETPALLDYARQSATDYLKIKESVDWTGMKKSLNVTADGKVISGDGEVLTFIRGEIQPDSISVKERK